MSQDITIPPDPPLLGLKHLPIHPCDAKRKQDLPPAGGYPPIKWRANPARKLLNGYMIFGGYLAMTAVSLVLYAINYEKIKKHEIELISHKMAIYPLLLAERDRAFLRQLRQNREEEENLMKNVNGWKVGTLYGEKVFYLKNAEEDLVEPIFHEYYGHADPRHFFKRAYHALRS